MSTPKGTGDSRRLRTAGLVLLMLAVVALLIGLVITVLHEQRVSAAKEPPVAPTHAPSNASVGPSVIPYPPPVLSAPPEPPVAALPEPPVAPGLPATGPPVAADGAPASGEGRRRGEVRVYNNSTIRGLAARVARDLTAAGWTVIDVGNYARGTIPTTTVYYQAEYHQEGIDQRADAEALGAQFGMRVEPRFPGIANAGPGLVVIVTNDYSH